MGTAIYDEVPRWKAKDQAVQTPRSSQLDSAAVGPGLCCQAGLSRFIPGHSLWIVVCGDEDKGNLRVEKIMHRISTFFLLPWIPVQPGLCC